MKRVSSAILALTVLLPTASARALGFHFEAWPTPTTDGCPAPCYQVRMFLEIQPWRLQQEIVGIQFDIDVQSGAIPAELPTPPDENDDAGWGNVVLLRGGRALIVPWDLVSSVGRSPNAGFDVSVVDVGTTFTVGALKAVVASSNTSCPDDLVRCDLVSTALALNRVYLGFFNVTREEGAPIGPTHDDPHTFNGNVPAGTPYFRARIGNLIGIGDALDVAFSLPHGSIPFLPEPSTGLLLAGALAILAPRRLRS